MFFHSGKFVLLLLLVMPTTLLLVGNGGRSIVAFAEEDSVEEDLLEDEEEGDATVESEDEQEEDSAVTDTDTEAEEGEEEDEEKPLKPSPDANTFLLFTEPAGAGTSNVELPAGRVVKVLVGFHNKAKQDFVIETMDASFRYPQDYSYYIQNFSTVAYDRTVEPDREATFYYAFLPSDAFSARPFGLTINVNYKDIEGNIFQDAVFNDTVNITEPDEGLDGETFFLYVFLAAAAVLLLVGAQQLLASFGKKRLSKPKPVIETGTQNKGDVDYNWLPMDHINSKSSPGRSPGKQSPKQRRSKRNKGSED